ncbi:hypothetical protein AVEN_139992-1 [Araneus ventricosus]|uniref:PilZ domain-containing protein n=1 Tax=Araneus ventricosus TaxID=182803 RepID=A0A4Y2NDW6_ARAVE|nr:hypothetical protein AVEN_139992-1 [Araneus ventricosus]
MQLQLKFDQDQEGEKGARTNSYCSTQKKKVINQRKLQEAIDPAKIEAGKRNVTNVNKGGILIECPTEDEIDKLRAEVELNLREEIDIRIPIKVRLKLTIHRVEKDADIEEFYQKLEE